MAGPLPPKVPVLALLAGGSAACARCEMRGDSRRAEGAESLPRWQRFPPGREQGGVGARSGCWVVSHDECELSQEWAMCDPPQPQRLAVRQVAAELGVSPQTIYRLFHAGKLLGLQVETAVRIDRASLDE